MADVVQKFPQDPDVVTLYADDKTKLRHAMRQAGLVEVRFRFDFEGTKTVIQ